jgi:hypothetical protein
VSNGSNRLHFDRRLGLERTVQKTWSVDGLESQVLVVKVTDVQRLGGEGVGRHLDIGAGDGLEETRLSDVGETAEEQGTGVRVDGGQTAQVLADLIQVGETVLETLQERSHATESGALELLALEKRLGIWYWY